MCEYLKILEINKNEYSERHYNAIKHCISNNYLCFYAMLNPKLKIEEISEIYKNYLQ